MSAKSEYMKAWRAKNAEHIKEYQRKWQEKNAEAIKEYSKEYYWKHREQQIAAVERSSKTERGRKRKRDNQNRYNRELRAALLDMIGTRCVRCGFDDPRALQIDHVNGGGRRHRSQFKSTKKYYKAIMESGGTGYQTLCANCNQIKKFENHELGNDGYRKSIEEMT